LAKILRLQTIDAINRSNHALLDATDDKKVYFWRDFTARKDYTFSETNNLVKNFKITPTERRADPRRSHHKERALNTFAAEFKDLILPTVVQYAMTVVPIPPSKLPGDPDHDDRITRLLETACAGSPIDIRRLIEHTQNSEADHQSTHRLTFTERMAITRLAPSLLTAPAPTSIVIFDDVLTNGTHYKVAKTLLARQYPDANISGVFVARRVQPPIEN
jgi:predicted amidophosphoribosyltransferase